MSLRIAGTGWAGNISWSAHVTPANTTSWLLLPVASGIFEENETLTRRGEDQPFTVPFVVNASGLSEDHYHADIVFDAPAIGGGEQWMRVLLEVRSVVDLAACTLDGYRGPPLTTMINTSAPLVFEFTARDLDGLPLNHGGDDFVAVLVDADGSAGSAGGTPRNASAPIEFPTVTYIDRGVYRVAVTLRDVALGQFAQVRLCRDPTARSAFFRAPTGVLEIDACPALPWHINFESVPLLEGWWRTGPASVDARPCPDPELCRCTPSNATMLNTSGLPNATLGQPLAIAVNASTHGSSVGQELCLCAIGQAGPYCQVCAPLYYKRGDACVPCSDTNGSWYAVLVLTGMVIALPIALLISCVMCGLCAKGRMKAASEATFEMQPTAGVDQGLGDELTSGIQVEADHAVNGAAKVAEAAEQAGQAADAAREGMRQPLAGESKRNMAKNMARAPAQNTCLTLGGLLSSEVRARLVPKIKILITLVQMLNGLDVTFDFKYPPLFREWLSWLAVFEWSFQLPDLGCDLTWTFHGRLYLHTIAPLGAVLVLYLLQRVVHHADEVLSVDADGQQRPSTIEQKLKTALAERLDRRSRFDIPIAIALLGVRKALWLLVTPQALLCCHVACAHVDYTEEDANLAPWFAVRWRRSLLDYAAVRLRRAEEARGRAATESGLSRVRDGLQGLRTTLVNGGFTLTFLTYPSVCRIIFAALTPCEEFDNGEAYLKADYAINCASTEHQVARVWAFTMLGVWVFGVWALSVAILFWHRKPIMQVKKRLHDERVSGRTRAMTQQTQHMHHQLPSYVRALTDAYEGHCFWWEAVEIIRKVVMVGLLIFFQPGSIEQLCLGLGLCVLFIAWYHHLKPYESDWDDRLQFLSQLTIFCTLMYAVILQVDASRRESDTMGYILLALAAVPPAVGIATCFIESCGSWWGFRGGECFDRPARWLWRNCWGQGELSLSLSGKLAPFSRKLTKGRMRAKTAQGAPEPPPPPPAHDLGAVGATSEMTRVAAGGAGGEGDYDEDSDDGDDGAGDGGAGYDDASSTPTTALPPPPVPPPPPELPPGWEQFFDDAGAVYYYCEDTGESRWNLPEEALRRHDHGGTKARPDGSRTRSEKLRMERL